MVTWQDFNITILTLLVMQIGIIVVILQHAGVIETREAIDRPTLNNMVVHVPRPPVTPSIFAPTNTL